jgi:hypothetical protein
LPSGKAFVLPNNVAGLPTRELPAGEMNHLRDIRSMKSNRHNPGTPGTRFSGAPDTIRTCDRCLSANQALQGLLE